MNKRTRQPGRVEDCGINIEDIIQSKRFKGRQDSSRDSTYEMTRGIQHDSEKLQSKLVNAYIDEVQQHEASHEEMVKMFK